MTDNGKRFVPEITPGMYKSVSEHRRASLEGEFRQGKVRDGNGRSYPNDGLSKAGNVAYSIKKSGQSLGSSAGTGGSNWRGSSDNTVRQVQAVYSPLWLNSNMNLPRDRATINSWLRSFFALHPYIQNAINLHSTYPISKLTIKCPNKKVESFFNDMIEEIDLMNVCIQIAQEYWLLGEAFVYAELDERQAKWSQLVIQNPDYIVVKRSVVANEPLVMLRPDENLRRIVFSNRPGDIEQRNQLNPTIVDHVKRGENIPLDNFYVSHLARKISPYEVRGTGLPVCVFRQLMIMDFIRECYDAETEVLTDQGFRKFEELLTEVPQDSPTSYTTFGTLDRGGHDIRPLGINNAIKIACVNQETQAIEYHCPTGSFASIYRGKMHHYSGGQVDVCVTPNHKMWIREKRNTEYLPPMLVKSSEIITRHNWHRFSNLVNWQGDKIEAIDVLGRLVPIELYLKMLGYVIAEGCVYSNGKYEHSIGVSQSIESPHLSDMKETFTLFASLIEKNCSHSIKERNNPNHKPCWTGKMWGKDVYDYFRQEISADPNDKCNSYNKRVPRWALSLNKSLLSVLLDALVAGDGSEVKSRKGTDSISWNYTTVSKQLADDIYELVYKCGFYPNLCVHSGRRDRNEYTITWSNTNYGAEPLLYPNRERDENGGGARVEEIDYDGIIWCFEVPTGLFITRRNGRIAVQGNSKLVQAQSMINPLTLVKVGTDGPDGLHPLQADLESWRQIFEEAETDSNFKIFTHAGVQVERVGWNQGILDTSNDITQLLKEICTGLMVPEIVMTGGGDITYANGGVSLDVLRNRYMSFRHMMANWLKRKIFAPISKLNEFYEHKEGNKELIIPTVEWGHMSIFDSSDYINMLIQLSGDQKKVSQQTLYRSLGLEYDEERRKIRKEDIAEAVRKKEIMSLDRLALNDLRSMNEDDEIPEITEVLPGQASPYDQPLPGQDMSGGMGSSAGPMGGLPPLPTGGLGGGLGGPPGGLGGGETGTPPPPPPTGTPPTGL